MTSIHVANGAQALVVTAGKSRAGTDTLRSLQNGPIHLHADFDHRIRFVGIFFAQQLLATCPKCALRSGDDRAILFLPSSNINHRE